jgi:FkbM family methyltransferase
MWKINVDVLSSLRKKQKAFDNEYLREFMSLQDLFLLGMASNYNLELKSERARSVKDLENLFFRIVVDLAPDLFIEAGAKDASISYKIRNYLPNASIIAFEANPYNFKKYYDQKRNESLRIQYIHSALSEKNGSVSFNVREVNGIPSADGQGSIMKSDAVSKPVIVKSTRLDNFVLYDSFAQCAIWMDVEGANESVLKGSSGILSKVQALFIEVEDRQFWSGQWLSRDVVDFLHKFNLIPVARDFQSRYQYNILFISKKLMQRDRIRFFLTEHASRSRFTNLS